MLWLWCQDWVVEPCADGHLLKLRGGHTAHRGRVVLVTSDGELWECTRDGTCQPIAMFGMASADVRRLLKESP